jgi:hypothetical protein
MFSILIAGGIAKMLAAKAVVAGTEKVGEVVVTHALANGAATALPNVVYGGTVPHAIGASTLGVTGSVTHGSGVAWGAAAAGGGSGAFGYYVVNEYANRDREKLEKLFGTPAGDFLWDGLTN